MKVNMSGLRQDIEFIVMNGSEEEGEESKKGECNTDEEWLPLDVVKKIPLSSQKDFVDLAEIMKKTFFKKSQKR